MHAHGINIFNAADDNDVVPVVSHYFEFKLFPTEDRLFQQDLMCGAVSQTCSSNKFKFLLIKGDTRTQSTHCERGPNHYGVVKFHGGGKTFLHGMTYTRAGRLSSNFLNDSLENLTILASFDGINIGSDKSNSILFERTTFM